MDRQPGSFAAFRKHYDGRIVEGRKSQGRRSCEGGRVVWWPCRCRCAQRQPPLLWRMRLR